MDFVLQYSESTSSNKMYIQVFGPLKIETLKENSRLILDLDSQFFSENSHSHSQLSKIF